MIAQYLLFWFLLAVVGITNGVIRQGTYGQVLTELTAHQISTVTGILATGVVVFFLNRAWPIESTGQAWTIGVCWLLFTVIFEFGFGHYVAGHPWQHLAADYNITKGRVWLLFLLWITLMPYVFFRLGQDAA